MCVNSLYIVSASCCRTQNNSLGPALQQLSNSVTAIGGTEKREHCDERSLLPIENVLRFFFCFPYMLQAYDP